MLELWLWEINQRYIWISNLIPEHREPFCEADMRELGNNREIVKFSKRSSEAVLDDQSEDSQLQIIEWLLWKNYWELRGVKKEVLVSQRTATNSHGGSKLGNKQAVAWRNR